MLSGRHAMVMDFGVAKAVTEASSGPQLTSAGVALGTPAYMAPEQATADPQMDARVDIYALGVMGYEMLTGAHPLPGLNPQQTLAAHVTRAPVPVGQQRAGSLPRARGGRDALPRQAARRPLPDRGRAGGRARAAGAPSGGITPTQTQPVAALAMRSREHDAGLPPRWPPPPR